MNWFKHDSNATTDFKIKKLLMKYGAIGYAVYFHCLELIASNVSETNITFELEHDAEIIADDLRIRGDATKSGTDIVEDIMRYMVSLDLFEESNGHIFCFKLLKRLDTSMTSNPKMRAIISEAKNKINAELVETNENHDEVMINHDSIMLDKNRLDKIRLDNNICADNSAETPKTKRFIHPSLDEIKAYCDERKNNVDSQKFYDYYESNGWKVGKNSMKDWKAAVRTWERNSYDSKNNYSKPTKRYTPVETKPTHQYTEEELKQFPF